MQAEKVSLYMDFNDLRLNERLEKILDALTEQPSTSIPEASKSHGDTKATYRFLDNERAETQIIRNGFYKATIEQIKQHSDKIIIYASDSTNLVFTSHKKLQGIGVLRNQNAKGLNLHTTVAYTEDELMLGAVYQICWGRNPEDYGQRALRSKKPIEEKESYRWIESFRAAQNSLPDNICGIFTGDRGADMYEIFLEERKKNMHILIRAMHDRYLTDSEDKMFSALDSSSCIGTMEVLIGRSGERKERITELELRYQHVSIRPPANKKNLSPIDITIVSAKEINDDKNIQDKIHWKLLTTLPIDSLNDAKYVIKTYAKRWLIERYHYTLKEGCKVEELQLREAHRIDKAVALYTIVACRLMYITYLARVTPDIPCSSVFSDDEWRALYCYAKQTSTEPKIPPSIKEAVLMLAKIGGFIGRKQDKDPGVKVIWRGLRNLEGAVTMYRILKGKDVGNV